MNIEERLTELIGHKIDAAFVRRIRERLAITWDVVDVDDSDIAATIELMRQRIESGRYTEPDTIDTWRERIADLVALIKGKR